MKNPYLIGNFEILHAERSTLRVALADYLRSLEKIAREDTESDGICRMYEEAHAIWIGIGRANGFNDDGTI